MPTATVWTSLSGMAAAVGSPTVDLEQWTVAAADRRPGNGKHHDTGAYCFCLSTRCLPAALVKGPNFSKSEKGKYSARLRQHCEYTQLTLASQLLVDQIAAITQAARSLTE